jgi:hypothetical protein
MPRYFLHVEGDSDRFDDEEGTELPNLEVARQTALRAAAQIIADDLASGVERLSQRIIVTDLDGAELLSVIVEAAVRIRVGSAA